MVRELSDGSGLAALQRRLNDGVWDGPVELASLSRPPRFNIQDLLDPRRRPDEISDSLRRRPERDGQGRIRRIPYVNGEAVIGRDSSGHVNSIEITRDGQRRKFIKEGNHWVLEMGRSGTRMPMRIRYPGDVQFNEANGDIAIQQGHNGRQWRVEQSDGTIVSERANATGARVLPGEGNAARRITRSNRTSAEGSYTDGELTRVTEMSADGTTRVWRRQADGITFTSDGQRPRRNYALEANGNTSYKDENGLTHIIRGNGVELIEGRGRAHYTFDNQGRITSLRLANGTGIREIGYDGDSNIVNRIVVNDRSAGGTKTFIRRGHGTTWDVQYADGRRNTAIGDARMGDDGTYMIRDTRNDRPGQPSSQHVWRTFAWDGRERRHTGDGQPSAADQLVHHPPVHRPPVYRPPVHRPPVYYPPQYRPYYPQPYVQPGGC